MSDTKKSENKIQWLLTTLIILGLLATSIISGVSWQVSQNLTQNIETLGNTSKVLAEGNLAISNTIANYLDRQERIASSNRLENLNEIESKSSLENDFHKQYQTLVDELNGLDLKEAEALKSAFTRFNSYDDGLFALKKEILLLDESVQHATKDVLAITDRTQTYANSLANKVKKFEAQKIKEKELARNQAKQREELIEQESLDEENLFEDFWAYSAEEEDVEDEEESENASSEREAKLKESQRVKSVLVDKNTKGKWTKSLISLHVSKLESSAQKLLLTNNYLDLDDVKNSEVIPELSKLNEKLQNINKIKISIEDYNKIIIAILEDVSKLSQHLTSEQNSLYANKRSY